MKKFSIFRGLLGSNLVKKGCNDLKLEKCFCCNKKIVFGNKKIEKNIKSSGNVNGTTRFEDSQVHKCATENLKENSWEKWRDKNFVHEFDINGSEYKSLREFLQPPEIFLDKEEKTYKFGLEKELIDDLRSKNFDTTLQDFKEILIKEKLDIEAKIAANRAVYIHPHTLYNYYPNDQSNHVFISGFSRQFLPKISKNRLEKRECISVRSFLRRALDAFDESDRKVTRKTLHICDDRNALNF